MRTCVISQPRFFPGLHYLHRIVLADVFIVLDTVQYNPRHEENRARILGPNGPQWLTVPMRRDSREQLILDTVVSEQPWRDKAVKTLHHLYGKTAMFSEVMPEVESVLRSDTDRLVSLDIESWAPALRRLQPSTEIVLASSLNGGGSGSELLLNLCRDVEAGVYLSGGFGREYLDLEAFAEAGIRTEFHEYSHPAYPQRSEPFVPYLSYLDALFNVGLTRELVEQGGISE